MNPIPNDLMAAIIERPDDDLLRLQVADWLEENGEGERAEFIRVQIELARFPPPVVPHGCYCSAMGERAPCGWCETVTEEEFKEYMDKGHALAEYIKKELRNKELSKHCVDWLSLSNTNNSTIVSWSCGFPHSVRCTMADFMPGECSECGGIGYRCSCEPDSSATCFCSDYPCGKCIGLGKQPGLAATIGGWPVTRVQFSDREPGRFGNTGQYYWVEFDALDRYHVHSLPPEIYSLVGKPKIYEVGGVGSGSYAMVFDTRELAISALSDAAILFARGEWERIHSIRRDAALTSTKEAS